MSINFYIDSQGVIKALESYVVQSKCVSECKRLLNALSKRGNRITLKWIPGHSGQLGNNIADGLAKLGAQTTDLGLEPRLQVSDSVTREVIDGYGKAVHRELWSTATEYRQSRLVLPDTMHRWSKFTTRMEREELRILTQLVTGHANLKRHRYLMGLEDNPDCNLCGEVQTSIHILTDCPGLAGPRTAILAHF